MSPTKKKFKEIFFEKKLSRLVLNYSKVFNLARNGEKNVVGRLHPTPSPLKNTLKLFIILLGTTLPVTYLRGGRHRDQ